MMTGNAGSAGKLLHTDRTDPLRRPPIAHAHGSAGGIAEQCGLVFFESLERLRVEVERAAARRIEAMHHHDEIGVELRVVLRRQGLGDLFHRVIRIDKR